MIQKIISIDITPNSDSVLAENGGVMWEHNATALKFVVAPELVGNYRYYIEYRSLMGTKVRTEYLELNAEDNTVTYNVPVSMSSLKAVEGFFNVVNIDEDGNTIQVIKPKKFQLTFDYSPDTDNSLGKVNDFSINSLLEAIRLGTFKGDKGDKGDKGEKGEKGDTGGISEEYATKNFANSIKGNANGTSVILEDVSPVEHSIDVRVGGKNLFDISKITASESLTSEHISEVGNDYMIVTTPDGYTSNGYCGTQITLKEFCPQLQVGKTYIINATTESNLKCVYLAAAKYTWNFGTVIVLTEAMLNSPVAFYGLNAMKGQGVGDCIISKLQIEEGETATEYASYIDPSTVTIKAFGKNLFDGLWELGAISGSTGDKVESTTSIKTTNYISVKPNTTYYFSIDANSSYVPVSYNANHEFVEMKSTLKGSFALTTGENDYYIMLVQWQNTEVPVNAQIELGTEQTEFETYKNPTTYSPNVDGTVENVHSVSPNMTIFADTEGVIVTVEYNRDLDKIIKKLIDTVVSLGGTV